jgi:hypothetical protein
MNEDCVKIETEDVVWIELAHDRKRTTVDFVYTEIIIRVPQKSWNLITKLVTFGSTDKSVGIVTRVRTGGPGSRRSIPSRAKRFLFS